MKILQITDSLPGHIPPPALDPEQAVGGPRYPDHSDNGRLVSIQTPAGGYDLGALISKLPPEQQPDLLVVRADSSKGSFPRNVGLPGRRAVLVVGDTHHDASPISTFVNYALSEPYDCVILDYTRQHGHFFVEAGIERVYWLPGFNADRIAIAPVGPPDIPASFVGNVGRLHGRRRALIEAIRRAGLPFEILSAYGHEGRSLHARTLINFNCSLNGDLNLRVLEVLASGGFLLTDRLGPESGLDILFEDGREYVAYDSLDDCIEKCRRYLRDPASATKIARAGNAVYEASLAPERIKREFFELVNRGTARPEFDLGKDRRTCLRPLPDRAKLTARIGVYEILQSMQRSSERSAVLMTPHVDQRLLSDASDLARVDVTLDACAEIAAPAPRDAFRSQAGLHTRTGFLSHGREFQDIRWDGVVATRQDWRSKDYEPIFAKNAKAVLIMSDYNNSDNGGEADAAEMRAAGFKRLTERAPVFTR